MKFFIPDQILAEWFIKSLLPKITEDVAKGGVVTKEQVIAQARYLDLVYTQSGTLYEKNLDLPCPGQITANPVGSHYVDGLIGTVNANKSKKKSSKPTSPIITLPDSPKGDSSPETSANIHIVDSSTTKAKTGNNKKGNNKNKQNTSPKEKKEKMNQVMKSGNLVILVLYVRRIIIPKSVHIGLRCPNLSKVHPHLLS